MSISSVVVNTHQNTSKLASSVAAVPNADGSAGSSPAVANADGLANSSSLSMAVSQALAQMRGGAGLAGALTPAAAQSGSDFTSSLLESLQGSSSSNAVSAHPLSGLYGSSSGQATNTVKLDPSSSTIKLQTNIQNLITQLDGNSSLGGGTAANTPSGLTNLQQSFNKLVTASGGNPSQASLQSFLKTVAANIQGSLSIGSMFDASA